MRAVVFHGIGDIRLDAVKEPKIEDAGDVIVRLTASAICGTDLHMVRGTFPGMVPGTILGHEGVGVVEEVGAAVRDMKVGDRVVVPSTICCGACSYCHAGYQSQCDNANPNGKAAGTAVFGAPKPTGPFHGLQAEYARVPFADATLVKLPDSVTDDQAILISDIFPTGYFGAHAAEIKPGDTVAVFGCGPVGLFAVLSAKLLGAGKVIAIDRLPDRLARAADLGAEVVNFDEEGPVDALLRLTDKVGPARVIDAVGVDAVRPGSGPAYLKSRLLKGEFKEEVKEAAVEGTVATWGGQWVPGDAPSQVLRWAVEAVAKAGTLSVIGVYPQTFMHFPIGMAMNKNLTLQMGNTPHRHYIPRLIEMVQQGKVDPTRVLSHVEPMTDAITAYKQFDKRTAGWIKVELKPAA